MLYDIVIGTFTHRLDNLPKLLSSLKKFHSDIPFVLQHADHPILENFEMLRKSFEATKKRFWIFLDDDIEFIQPVLNACLISMMKNRWAMVGTYSTYDPNYDFKDKLVERESGWLPGYFQMIDSSKVGHVQPDFNLPDHCTAIDTSYSVTIKSLGHKIGIAPVVVYHQYKTNNFAKPDVIKVTNEYLMKKWGKFYFDCCSKFEGIVGSIPEDPMIKNRNYLQERQKREFAKVETDKIKVNIGCGETKYLGYINVDLYGDPDVKADMKNLPFDNNSVDVINAQHVLEHIPYRCFEATLKEWHRVLKKGGELEIGIPDIELCFKRFLESPEDEKWSWLIHTIYGVQADPIAFAKGIKETDPVDFGQLHQGGLSLNRLKVMLENVGFSIEQSFNYDGNNTPSAYCLARAL